MGDRSVGRGLTPNIDLHDLIKRDAVLAPVVELLVRLEACAGIWRAFIERAPAGAAEGVVAHQSSPRLDRRMRRSPKLMEPISIRLESDVKPSFKRCRG